MKNITDNKLYKRLSSIPAFIKNYNRISMDIAAALDDLLKDKGWKQKELAKILGKNESEISKWLNGKHNFTIKSIAKLEEVFNTQIVFTKFDNLQNEHAVSNYSAIINSSTSSITLHHKSSYSHVVKSRSEENKFVVASDGRLQINGKKSGTEILS